MRKTAVPILAFAVIGLAALLSVGSPALATDATSTPCFGQTLTSTGRGPSCESSDPNVRVSLFNGSSSCTYQTNVEWGDGATSSKTYAGQTSSSRVLVVSFTHMYGTLGTYPVTVTTSVASGPCSGSEVWDWSFTLGKASMTCYSVEFIGARGSGQSAAGYDGMGAEIDHVAKVLKSDLEATGDSMKLVPANYPADPVTDLAPSAEVVQLWDEGHKLDAIDLYRKTSLAKYEASIDRGFNAMMIDFIDAVSACPSARVVLAGYSQGAMVVHEAESWIAAHLSKDLSRIGGTVLVADPERDPGTRAKAFGTASPKAEGIHRYLVGGRDVVLPAKTATIANRDDIVADFAFKNLLTTKSRAAAIAVHTNYAREVGHTMVYDPALAAAADWIDSLIETGE